MNKHWDIDYLRDYTEGKLSAKQMHQLERLSLEDEQLMDMLMGLEQEKMLGTPVELRDLHSAIYERTRGIHHKKRKPVYKIALIAASIAIAVGITLVFFQWWPKDQLNNPQKDFSQLEEERRPSSDSSLIALHQQNDRPENDLPDPKEQQNPSASPRAVSGRKPELSSEELRAAVIADMIKNKSGTFLKGQQSLPQSPVDLSDSSLLTSGPLLASNFSRNSSSVIEINRPRALSSSTARLASPGSYNTMAARQVLSPSDSSMEYSGLVLDRKSARPIVSATVKDLNTGQIVTTDSTGHYRLKPGSSEANQQLEIMSIGYQATRVLSGNNKIIQLTPDQQILEEVLINEGKSNKASQSSPLIGLDAYKKYINTQASAYHKKGWVVLRFDVSLFGRPSDIRVKSSSDASLNALALELVRKGPDWKKGSSGKLVELRIDFH